MRYFCFGFLLFVANGLFAQYPLKSHPYSTQGDDLYSPCRDTFNIFGKHLSYDVGEMLPSWEPVVNKNFVAVIEGQILFNTSDGTNGPHVSSEDLPFYHFSHDMDFDLLPDSTDDGRFTNFLPFRVHNRKNRLDTVLNRIIHCEWETGLGMGNKLNPLHEDNDAGRSGGFYSGGHELKDVIWNWPAVGDWAHVEGNFVWDRGHPPSKTEIHPIRLVAIKRALPEQVIIGDSSVKFATRVDIFASGDGGAIMNNRYNSPGYVRRVNMSSKDYDITVKVDLPRPSKSAHLKYTMIRRKGDSFSSYELIDANDDSSVAHIHIPWMTKNANDLEVYARTFNFYWDEGNGVSTELPVDIYKVKLNGIRFAHLNEVMTKAEVRMFANVGNDWIFVNDFFGRKGKILTKGMGKTRKHKWSMDNEFTVSVPRGSNFRVYLSGWEVDGVDVLFGKLIDPYSACNKKTKRFIKSSIFSVPMVMRGCMDDDYGETSHLYNSTLLTDKKQVFTDSPQHGKNDDPCPCSKYPLKDRVFFTYTIEKVN